MSELCILHIILAVCQRSRVSVDVWPGNVHLFGIMEMHSHLRTISTMSKGGCAIDVYLVLSARPCTTPVALVIHTHVCCCFIQCTKGADSLLSFKSIHSLSHHTAILGLLIRVCRHTAVTASIDSPFTLPAIAHSAPSFEQFFDVNTTTTVSASCGEYCTTMLL